MEARMKLSSSGKGIGVRGMIGVFVAFSFSLPTATKRSQPHLLKILTLGTVSVFAALHLILFVVSPVYGIALEFGPTGSQVDKDEIWDLLVSRGDTITFTVSYNPGATEGVKGKNETVMKSAAAKIALTEIRYSVGYDKSELQLVSIQILAGTFNIGRENHGPGTINIVHGGGNIPPGGEPTVLDRITFMVTDPVDNGVKDFWFDRAGTEPANLGGGKLDFTQVVEVQPLPEPTTLLLVSSALVGLVVLGRKGLPKRRF
jgi:hypothetical protein